MRTRGFIGRVGRALAFAAVCIFAVWLIFSACAFPQESPKTNSEPRDSLKELASEVRLLESDLAAMRKDLDQSRAESQTLSRELEETRHELASLGRQLSARSQAAQPANEAQGVAPAGKSAAAEGARQARLEEGQQLLSNEVRDQAQTKVESGSKYRVRLSGIALLNLFSSRGSVDNFDVPTLAVPPFPTASNANFGATVRQSLLGLEVFGPTVAGARSSGGRSAG